MNRIKTYRASPLDKQGRRCVAVRIVQRDVIGMSFCEDIQRLKIVGLNQEPRAREFV